MSLFNIYCTLSAPATRNIFLNPVLLKGTTTVNFVLTGINEEISNILFLDINWGDSSNSLSLQRDIIFNYKEQSIFDEVLYGKLRGSVATIHSHVYNNTTNAYNTSLTAVINCTFNTGDTVRFIQPINVFNASFYDRLGDLSISKTQIQPNEDSNTFAILEGQNNKFSYISILKDTRYPGQTGAPIPFIQSFKPHANAQIDDRIGNVLYSNISNSKLIFTTINNSTSTYIRNPLCWASDVDLTGLPVYNSQTNNNRFGGSLITRRHVINAAHSNPAPGSTLRFVDANNNVYVRTIVAREVVFNFVDQVTTDINISLLDQDLPTSIKSYTIMPKEVIDLIPDNLEGDDRNIFNPATRTAMFYTDQELKALVIEHVHNSYGLVNTDNRFVYLADPLDSTRVLFYEQPIGGDSGSAVGFIVNNELVIVTAFTFLNRGDRYGFYADKIQSVINNLNTLNGVPNTYNIELFDLSGFTI
jgi:hypothetical protein